MTGTIQPPLLAWAWRIAVGDPAAEPRIARHHEWLGANRDLEGDGLLWLVQPDESGLDSSPKFDPVWGRRAHARLGFPFLVARNRRLGWDARRVRDAGGPVLCEVVDQRALGARPPGDGRALDHARRWSTGSGTSGGGCSSTRRSRAACGPRSRPGPRWRRWPCPTCPRRSGAAWSRSTCWTRSASGCRCPRPRSPRPSRASSRARRRAGAPLLARPDLGQRRLAAVARAGAAGLPRPRPSGWRAALAEAVLREGLREYYDPRTGAGLGATDFAWTSLIVEMADPATRRGRQLPGRARASELRAYAEHLPPAGGRVFVLRSRLTGSLVRWLAARRPRADREPVALRVRSGRGPDHPAVAVDQLDLARDALQREPRRRSSVALGRTEILRRGSAAAAKPASVPISSGVSCDPLRGRMRRGVRHRLREGLVSRHVLERDLPDVGAAMTVSEIWACM